ncbi:MAG: hypothetical protein MJZ34_11235 [Paludibacteraceae bacterium]|nr:hypothetical protein [Paludibacteraceae bacterium]
MNDLQALKEQFKKDLSTIVEESVFNVKYEDNFKFKFLNEEDDPFADDGDDMGGDDDGGSSDGDGDTEIPEGEEQPVEREKDDDFEKGIKNQDSVVLDKVPAGKTIYSADKLLANIDAMLSATTDSEELNILNALKSCAEFVFSGQKLVYEDLEPIQDTKKFKNILKDVLKGVDSKSKNYFKFKISKTMQDKANEEKLKKAEAENNIDKIRDNLLELV